MVKYYGLLFQCARSRSINATVLQWLKALDDTEEQLEQISGSHGGDMTFRVFLDIAPCNLIALMMEAVRISETSVHSNKTTRRYIPEDSKLLIEQTSMMDAVSVSETSVNLYRIARCNTSEDSQSSSYSPQWEHETCMERVRHFNFRRHCGLRQVMIECHVKRS
jgi:hypothetical protein